MPNKDFIPKADAQFNQWQSVLLAAVAASATVWTVPAAAVAELETLQTSWQDAFAAAENPATRTSPAVLAKNEARRAYESALRRVVKSHLIYNENITDEQRADMGLPVHDTTLTPAPTPKTAPVGEVDFSQHQCHTLRVKDSVHQSKPVGVRGFEVWHSTGVEPTADDDFRYTGFSSATSFTVDYPMQDVGKTVYYRFRWKNTRNEPGPWSETVNAVVA